MELISIFLTFISALAFFLLLISFKVSFKKSPKSTFFPTYNYTETIKTEKFTHKDLDSWQIIKHLAQSYRGLPIGVHCLTQREKPTATKNLNQAQICPKFWFNDEESALNFTTNVNVLVSGWLATQENDEVWVYLINS